MRRVWVATWEPSRVRQDSFNHHSRCTPENRLFLENASRFCVVYPANLLDNYVKLLVVCYFSDVTHASTVL